MRAAVAKYVWSGGKRVHRTRNSTAGSIQKRTKTGTAHSARPSINRARPTNVHAPPPSTSDPVLPPPSHRHGTSVPCGRRTPSRGPHSRNRRSSHMRDDPTRLAAASSQAPDEEWCGAITQPRAFKLCCRECMYLDGHRHKTWQREINRAGGVKGAPRCAPAPRRPPTPSPPRSGQRRPPARPRWRG